MRTLLAAAFLLALQPVTLQRAPAVGETTRFDLKMETTWEGKSLVFSGRQEESVTAVNLDGTFEMTSKQISSKVSYDGQESDVPAGEPTIFRYGPDNEPLALIGDRVDADAFRLTRVTTVIFPTEGVTEGGTWTRELRDDPEQSLPPVKLRFTFEGSESVAGNETYRIKIEAEELDGDFPTKVTGHVWVSSKTGAMVKAKYVIDEAPVAGNRFDINLTIEPATS